MIEEKYSSRRQWVGLKIILSDVGLLQLIVAALMLLPLLVSIASSVSYARWLRIVSDPIRTEIYSSKTTIVGTRVGSPRASSSAAKNPPSPSSPPGRYDARFRVAHRFHRRFGRRSSYRNSL